MTGNQRVTVQPNEWNSGRQPRIDELRGRLRRVANWQTLARTLRWLRTTPFGSPEEPEVNSSAASSSPRRWLRPSNRPSAEAGRSLEISPQRTIFGLSVGRTRSMKIRSRLGGHGKVEIFRTNGSAVM